MLPSPGAKSEKIKRKTSIKSGRDDKSIWKSDEEYRFISLIKAHYQSGKDVAKDARRMTFKGKNWARDLISNSELFKGANKQSKS